MSLKDTNSYKNTVNRGEIHGAPPEYYTIGLDYGTLSGRAVLVRTTDGKVISTALCDYPHKIMTELSGNKLPEGWALQHPEDYIHVLIKTVREVMEHSGVPAERVIGIGIDFTSCTVLPLAGDGTPLCFKEEFVHSPHAYVKLWKHHGAFNEADIINSRLYEKGLHENPVFGYRVSSEVMAPKALQILREDKRVYDACSEIVEAGDYLTRLLGGGNKRSISMAGYKAWWNEDSGYPETSVYASFDPGFKDFATSKMPGDICGIGESVGCLKREWAERLGLCEGIAVAPAVIDSHAGLPGSGIYKVGQLMLVTGTSSVLLAMSPVRVSERGIVSGAKGSIVPGYFCFESGLAGVGDMFDWYINNMLPVSVMEDANREGLGVHELLSKRASGIDPAQSHVIALDWWNGNKTPYVDSSLKGLISGFTLSTKPEEIYRALIESTAFGTKAILDIFREKGCEIREIIASGGISQKNPLIMQIYADVLGVTIKTACEEQTAALGSAIYAALAAGSAVGGYDSYESAVKCMGSDTNRTYTPDKDIAQVYENKYKKYLELGMAASKLG